MLQVAHASLSNNIYSLINPSVLLSLCVPEGTAGHMGRVGVFLKARAGARPIDKCQQFQGQIEDSDSLFKGKATKSFSLGKSCYSSYIRTKCPSYQVLLLV